MHNQAERIIPDLLFFKKALQEVETSALWLIFNMSH